MKAYTEKSHIRQLMKLHGFHSKQISINDFVTKELPNDMKFVDDKGNKTGLPFSTMTTVYVGDRIVALEPTVMKFSEKLMKDTELFYRILKFFDKVEENNGIILSPDDINFLQYLKSRVQERCEDKEIW